MSRRRKIEIKASELACFDTLVETLRTRPEFADLDPTSLHVWAYENYEPTIRNAARAIRHFDHWLAAHRNEMFLSSYSGNRLFCKKDLAEALGITRPTLDRWIANGWLEGCTARAFSNGERCYSADAVREALEKLKQNSQKQLCFGGRFLSKTVFFYSSKQSLYTLRSKRKTEVDRCNSFLKFHRLSDYVRSWQKAALFCNTITYFRQPR